MRVKTLEKKKKIIDVAIRIFKEKGYESASMAEISAQLGGSKATLYNYFSSKEELFSVAVEETMKDRSDKVFGALEETHNSLEETLTDFGTRLLDFITSDDVIEILRISISQTASTNLGPRLFKLGPEKGWKRVIAYLTRMIEAGVLKQADPKVMSMHFKGLLEGGVFDAKLLNVTPYMPLDEVVKNAVTCFMIVYSTTPPSSPYSSA